MSRMRQAREFIVERGDARLVEGVDAGQIVRAGTAGAIWLVHSRTVVNSGAVRFILLEHSPHDLPFDARIIELPLQVPGRYVISGLLPQDAA